MRFIAVAAAFLVVGAGAGYAAGQWRHGNGTDDERARARVFVQELACTSGCRNLAPQDLHRIAPSLWKVSLKGGCFAIDVSQFSMGLNGSGLRGVARVPC